MTINIDKLRQALGAVQPEEVEELLDRLEAAENELVEIRHGAAVANDTIKALRAKVEAMERQKPVAKVRVHQTGGNAGLAWSVAPLNDFDSLPLMRDGDRLYALPGAQAQNAPKAVAYLDLGVGGYMDIGTDLTDEELATLPKGRHMLGVIGTYGVDGYVPTQPAPSVPDGWKLVPIEPTPGMKTAGIGVEVYQDSPPSTDCLTWEEVEAIYTAMLAAAPEAKP